MRSLPLALTMFAALAAAQDLPISGIAGAGLLTVNLEASRRFYAGTLGFQEAFSLKNEKGKVVSSFFKVNDEQYIQVTAGAPSPSRLAYIALLTPDIQGLRKLLLKRGVFPSMPAAGPDAVQFFSLKDPEGVRIDFVQRVPESLPAKAAGKYLGPNRVSTRLAHAGMISANADSSLRFYTTKLGLAETWRGGPKDGELRWIVLRCPGLDGIELMLYTEPPGREQLGAMQHLSFQVPEAKAASEQLARNGYTGTPTPRVGRNGYRSFSILDPDGTRIEFMEAKPAR